MQYINQTISHTRQTLGPSSNLPTKPQREDPVVKKLKRVIRDSKKIMEKDASKIKDKSYRKTYDKQIKVLEETISKQEERIIYVSSTMDDITPDIKKAFMSSTEYIRDINNLCNRIYGRYA